MRGAFTALSERLGRRRPTRAAAPSDAPPALTAGMARGATEMQSRLEHARSRLKRDIAPPSEDG